MASQRGSGSKPPLPPVLEGFGETDKAAVAEFGQRFDGIELGALEEDEIDPVEQARKSAGKQTAPAPQSAPRPKPKPAKADHPNLEPVSDDAHRHRRIPTQPPSALQLDLDEAPHPSKPAPSSQPSSQPSSHSLPPPPVLAPRKSPAPVRRGLFSSDQITNMLGCVAVGSILMIYPARQIARGYEAREVEPLIGELQGAIDHPLGVQAGLVEKPEAIAARIHEGRGKVRRRYMGIWLLVGVPIGIGLSFIRL